jgi:hypothetical protein
MSGKVVDNLNDFHNNILLQEFYRLEKELSNQPYSTVSPSKLARFNELKKYVQAFENAKEKIKQRMISADKSPDNSVIFTAITNFKKTNE